MGFEASEINNLMNGPNFPPASQDEQGRLDQKDPLVCPACGHEFTP